VNRTRWCAALALIAGCSNLSGPKGQPVSLELDIPVPAVVEQNDTLRLRARALDLNGDSVAATIVWRSADTTLIMVDSTGLVTTTLTSGTGRVQAVAGSLLSTLTQFTIRPRSDTLALTSALTDTVPATDTASAVLGSSVLSLNPAGGVFDNRVLYEVVDTVAALGTVRFAGGGLSQRVATLSSGAVPATVTLLKVPGATPPASVQVRVSASRPSGTPVPGSGQSYTILFQ
jgi:hypothetical protein